MQIEIISFYKFFTFTTEDVSKLELALNALAKSLDDNFGRLTVRGLTILGTEGANATYSVPIEAAPEFRLQLLKLFAVDSLPFKISRSDRHAFHDFKIKVREEIVTLERPDLVPQGECRHLSPEEWNLVIANEDPILIDTRNSYEYEIGRFKNAIDPKIDEFNEFPEWVEKANLPKDKKILIYCTGGIRCEKAILAMEEKGFNNVYQLNGGVLSYLEHHKASQNRSEYEGECFVFDYRIAVDHNLAPTTKYRLCPHCGQPGQTKIECVQCGHEDVVCDGCLKKGAEISGDILRSELRTCSKNCAHHFRKGHITKRMHQDAFNRREIR